MGLKVDWYRRLSSLLFKNCKPRGENLYIKKKELIFKVQNEKLALGSSIQNPISFIMPLDAQKEEQTHKQGQISLNIAKWNAKERSLL